MNKQTRREVIAALLRAGRRDLAKDFARAAGKTLEDFLKGAVADFWEELIPALRKATVGSGNFVKGTFDADGLWLHIELRTKDKQVVNCNCRIALDTNKLHVGGSGKVETGFSWDGVQRMNTDRMLTYILRVIEAAAKGHKL